MVGPTSTLDLPLYAHLNAVEGFFASLQSDRFVIEHNAEPKPFPWTANRNTIIQAPSRGLQFH